MSAERSGATVVGNVRQQTVWREPGRFAGWPANYGIWSWDEGNAEIVVGFTVGRLDPTVTSGHARDKAQPFHTYQARSDDGGMTWRAGSVPAALPGGRALSADEHMNQGLRLEEVIDGADGPTACPGGLDFTAPGFALMCARTGLGPGCRSFFYASEDRCRSWNGPFWLPAYGMTGVAARTDYLVDDATTCTLFLTGNKGNGREGRVFAARTRDGGASFELLATIGPEPAGFAIMPASVRLPDGRILVAVRCKGERGCWLDLWSSADDGASWECVVPAVADTGRGGNPATLTLLRDGRLCLIYGRRSAPFTMCARLSGDQGATWGEPVVLRSGAGCSDFGYPRTVQRADGAIVTCYYWNDAADGERYIAATIFEL